MLRSFFYFTFSAIFVSRLCAIEPKELPPEPKTEGNFMLPSSQAISPLVGFGQTIIGKGIFQTYLNGDGFFGKKGYLSDLTPYVVYGILDDLSLSAYFPFSPGNMEGANHSAGIEDFSLELEYAFFARSGSYYEDQATIVADVNVPTGSSTKTPPTGDGAVSVFVGVTLVRLTYHWYFYTSPGVWINTATSGTKKGNEVYYQFGLGRNLFNPSGWVLSMLVEIDGTYSWKDKLSGSRNPDSGGNIVYVTPSLWLASKKTILQLGIGYPALQNLYGNQSRQYFSVNFNIGFTL